MSIKKGTKQISIRFPEKLHERILYLQNNDPAFQGRSFNNIVIMLLNGSFEEGKLKIPNPEDKNFPQKSKDIENIVKILDGKSTRVLEMVLTGVKAVLEAEDFLHPEKSSTSSTA